MHKAAVLAVTCLLCGQACRAQEELTYVDLARRLTDLERLAALPAPGEKCMQHSSYDRRSKYDAASGKYIYWHANGDGNGFIRKEGDGLVLAEMDGPGCIWRIWSAKPEKGHVRIYLDGKDAPAVDLPFKAYFDRTAKPFVHPSLCYMAARGQNCYVPIPFRKSCKIVAEKGWGRYFHFTYSVFPASTSVPSFRLPLSADEEAALAAADAFLSNRFGSDPAGKRAGQKEERRSVTLASGKAETVFELPGPRAITALKVRTSFDGREDEMDALRELTLRITWDGEAAPAVWSPLGDFFGTAPGLNAYKSLPLGMTKDGFYSFWYMPFARSAKIELGNDGDKARKVELHVVHAPLTRPIERLGRFHAKWHRDAFLPKTKDRWPDWTLLTTAGRGRFCGVMLHVWNPKGGQCPQAGEGRWWWGEGDEKFLVDGEKFPSTFGTGSEDYFGYAWGNATLFARAYHNQTISMGNRGHISVNRWHVTDNVPFRKSFEGCIEKYFPNDWPTLYAAIAYWYQAPGGRDPYRPVPIDQRTGWYAQPKVFHVKGAIEGEQMKVLEKTGGDVGPQALASFGRDRWSRNAHLWWKQGKPGDKLVLALPVKQAGRYELRALLTKAKDYGIVKLSLDGKPLGKPIDLYNPQVVPTKELSFGVHELAKGDHKLTVEVVGANEKAVKSHMFGLDYVLLKPAN
jgi:hypothetical protein